MKLHSKLSLAAVALLSICSSLATAAGPSLAVGLPAPELRVAKWLKGTPVEKLERGQVYVVEFWATWCGPCKATMPHVTSLAKKYAGKATIIGVSVWERPPEETDASLLSLVEATVKSMGDRMDYNVAADGLDKFMATTWMEAAGQKAIPCAFIVDREGKIAWIGLPAKMDDVLEAVVNGTWDREAEIKRAAEAAEAERRQNQLIAPILEARKNKDAAAILAAYDKALAADPDFLNHPDLLSIQLQAMLELDRAKAVSYIETLSKKDGLLVKKPSWVWAVLRVLPLEQSSKPLTEQESKTLAAALEAPVKEAPNMHHFVAYASLAYSAGDAAKAVEYQKLALESARKANDLERLKSWFAEQERRLETYRAKVG